MAAFAALLLAVAPFEVGLANSQTLIFNDFCTSTIRNLPAAYTAGSLQLQITTVGVTTPGGVPRFAEANAYQYALSITSGGGTIGLPAQSCPANRTYEISNTPGGAAVGNTVPEENVASEDVPGWLEQFFSG